MGEGARRRGRRRSVLVLAAAGASGLAIAATASAAAADDSVTINNANNLTVHSDQTLSIVATASGGCGVNKPLVRDITLTLTGPSGADPKTKTLKSETANCRRDATLKDSIGSPNRNGAYTVTLENGRPSRTTTADLDVLIPPAQAKGLNVRTSGTTASFTWQANPEPDVVEYQVASSSQGVVAASPPSRSCSGGSCAAAVDLGHKAAGTTQKFTVRAIRCGMSCSGSGDVAGPKSAPVSASFSAGPSPPAPPPPSSTPTGLPSHSTGTGHGHGHNGGHGHGGPGPAATASAIATPDSAPSTAGHHHDGKGNHVHPSQSPTPSAVATSPTPAPTAVSSSTTSTSDSGASGVKAGPIWRGLAAVAILLLIGLHLRSWSRRVDSR